MQERRHSLDTSPSGSGNSATPEHRNRQHVNQMYQPYRKQDQQRGLREEKRYSWEGHPSEKVFTTFEQMAERGIISKKALKKK